MKTINKFCIFELKLKYYFVSSYFVNPKKTKTKIRNNTKKQTRETDIQF